MKLSECKQAHFQSALPSLHSGVDDFYLAGTQKVSDARLYSLSLCVANHLQHRSS